MENSIPVVKHVEWIKDGFLLYKKNFVVLVLATLVAAIMNFITLQLLFGPMFAGLIVIILACLDNKEPKAKVRDIFNGFQYFLNSFLFFLMWAIPSVVIALSLAWIPSAEQGPITAVFILVSISTFVMFGMFLIVDRKMNFWQASKASINLVKANFFPFAGLMIVAGILYSIGSLAWGIGIIITMPIGACIIAVAYRDLFGKQ